MRSFVIPVILILCFCSLVFGNSWVARYNGPGPDVAFAMAVDSSGDVYATGTSNDDYITIKFDPNGDRIWVAGYNGPSNGYDAAQAITLDNANNIYVTGYSYDDVNSADYLTIKYDPDGSQLWAASYDGPAHQFDQAIAIAVSANGNVYVTGQSTGNDVNSSVDSVTIKYNSSGVQQWVNRYNYCSDTDVAKAITIDKAGNAYVTGESYSDTNGTDYVTIKYSSGGSQQWAKRYPSTKVNNYIYDSARAIAIDDSNNVYVTGISDSNYLTMKYNQSGTLQWSSLYDGAGHGDDTATAIALAADGNVCVTGQSYGGDNNLIDYATIKYKSSNGNRLWTATYNNNLASNNDYAESVAVDTSGNVYVTGQSWSGDIAQGDYATVKYDSSGVQQWAARYNGPGSNSDYAIKVAVDTSANVYVAGTSNGFETVGDIAVIKNPNEIPYCSGPVVGDLNHDCVVDFSDFGEFASHWLDTNLQ